VIGIFILTLVDALWGSKATTKARKCLMEALNCTTSCLTDLLLDQRSAREHRKECRAKLDSLLLVMPYADGEPIYWNPPFKHDLYVDLSQQITRLMELLDTLDWVCNGRSPVSMGSGGSEVKSRASSDIKLKLDNFDGGNILTQLKSYEDFVKQLGPMLKKEMDKVNKLAGAATGSLIADNASATRVHHELQSDLYTEEAAFRKDRMGSTIEEYSNRGSSMPSARLSAAEADSPEEDWAELERNTTALREDAEDNNKSNGQQRYEAFELYARSELVIALGNSLIREVQQMQLVLMEY